MHNIIIKNILNLLINIHKIIFQNLFLKLYNNFNNNKTIKISLTVIDNNNKNKKLNDL